MLASICIVPAFKVNDPSVDELIVKVPELTAVDPRLTVYFKPVPVFVTVPMLTLFDTKPVDEKSC